MKAKFDSTTKKEILLRDRYCIICKKNNKYGDITDYHHVYFGIEAEYGDNRNNVNKGVGLCRNCHNEIHHGNKGLNILYRNLCKEYLHMIYR